MGLMETGAPMALICSKICSASSLYYMLVFERAFKQPYVNDICIAFEDRVDARGRSEDTNSRQTLTESAQGMIRCLLRKDLPCGSEYDCKDTARILGPFLQNRKSESNSLARSSSTAPNTIPSG